VAAIGLAAFQLHRVRDERHVGVTEREEGIEVTRFKVSNARRTTSTFSCDIAHPVSRREGSVAMARTQ
jgi:hypothetical protein